MAGSAHRFRLFVSAGADLEAEHEAIGRAVAQITRPLSRLGDSTDTPSGAAAVRRVG